MEAEEEGQEPGGVATTAGWKEGQVKQRGHGQTIGVVF